MVIVSAKAAEELRNTLVAVAAEADQVLRLIYSASGGFALTLDDEQEGDQVVESDGQKVLLIGSDVQSVAGEANIDVQDEAEGPRLVISV
ncbi:MAG TPA: hypothetical protein VJM69_05805 [Dehalococcoidia bacterium]|nr:hypothetical protein [Dehalococcoidia bacterium]